MSDWDFSDDQTGKDEQDNWDRNERHTDQYGNVWVYGRRGWRILGDYDG